jgi:hypothetical protein
MGGMRKSRLSDFKHFRINHSKLFADKKIISMALRIFGTKPSVICASLLVFQKSILAIFKGM